MRHWIQTGMLLGTIATNLYGTEIDRDLLSSFDARDLDNIEELDSMIESRQQHVTELAKEERRLIQAIDDFYTHMSQEETRLGQVITDYNRHISAEENRVMTYIEDCRRHVAEIRSEIASLKNLYANERIAMATEAIRAQQTGIRDVIVSTAPSFPRLQPGSAKAIQDFLLPALTHTESNDINLKLYLKLNSATGSKEQDYISVQATAKLTFSLYLQQKQIDLSPLVIIAKNKSKGVKFKPECNAHLLDWIRSALAGSDIAQFLQMTTLDAPLLPAIYLEPQSTLRGFPAPNAFPGLPLTLRAAPRPPQREEGPIYQEPDEVIAQMSALSLASVAPGPTVPAIPSQMVRSYSTRETTAWSEQAPAYPSPPAPSRAFIVEEEDLEELEDTFNPDAWKQSTVGPRPHLDTSFDSFEADQMQ